MGGVRRQGPPLLTQEGGAVWLATQVAESRLFAAGKLGTSELNAILFYVSNRASEGSGAKPQYPDMIKRHMFVNAGLFSAAHTTQEQALDDWCDHMIKEVLPQMDGLAEWNPISPLYESMVLNAYSPDSARFPLRSLEPYYCAKQQHKWTARIPPGHELAVVSPFAATIESQYTKQADVWSSASPWSISPPTVHTIRAGYSPSLSAVGLRSSWSADILRGGWRAAVLNIVERVAESGAKFAIIGCGCLSLPIAAALKKHGISSIHLGGATQILFGVKGRRWASHDIISKFFNDAWVSPADDETPTSAASVEGGCYW
jgi:hypothetical protein